MFRIRRIYDLMQDHDRELVGQVQSLLREQFMYISEQDVLSLPEQLHDPLRFRFRSILFVAQDGRGRLMGFAILLHSTKPAFCFLDYISIHPKRNRGGVGSALYQRLRQEAISMKSLGIFLECLSDDPTLCSNRDILRQNASRLKFYERLGARPIINTAYETPIKADDPCPPHLLYDDLGRTKPLGRRQARAVVRAILERRYGAACPEGYIDRVVHSFKDDPVRLRKHRYTVSEPVRPMPGTIPEDYRIALVVTDRHDIHHVRQRGYVESPARISSIQTALEKTGLFAPSPIRHYSDRILRTVHDPAFVNYLQKVCANIGPKESIYPYVFPLRNAAREPVDLPVRAGYYCIDTFTPLNRMARDAAKRAVDCALTAADALARDRRLAYALVRPPGHHAERRAFGGFCYFNSTAIAAHHLSLLGRIAVLDIDYHHGNGTQMIFYNRADVLTVSLHGHPRFAYPYFSGFDDERGEGPGLGFNVNMPLPEKLEGGAYRVHLEKALKRIRRFEPKFLVVALGLDTAKADPTGTWSLDARDFEANGRLIGALRLPTLVVQEGGYRIRSLGTNASRFFRGLWRGTFEDQPPKPKPRVPGTTGNTTGG